MIVSPTHEGIPRKISPPDSISFTMNSQAAESKKNAITAAAALVAILNNCFVRTEKYFVKASMLM